MGIIHGIRKRREDVSITTDIIVGFPGESEQDFNDSLSAVDECRFSKVHSFPFSPRPGTPAAGMEGGIGREEKQRRARVLAGRAAVVRERYMETLTGRTVRVVPEAEGNAPEGFLRGLSEYYTPVLFRGDDSFRRKLIRVLVQGLRDGVQEGMRVGAER